MKTILLALSSLISFGAPLTTTQLDQVRQRVAASGVPINFTKAAVNVVAQSTQTWIEANRGALPNKVTAAGLSGAQSTAVRAAIGGTFTNAQKATVFDAVGLFHEIVTPPPPDPLDAAFTAARQALIQLFNSDIDAAQPGLSNAEKRRAVRLAIDSL